MPLQLYLPEPRRVDFRQITQPFLAPHEVRIQTHLTGIHHGRDLIHFSDNFVTQESIYPCIPQTWGVGEIIEVGSAVDRYSIGDIVHAPMHHQEQVVIEAERAEPVQWIRKEFPVFIDPGVFALHAVRESGVKYGDQVAIFGMGAVGLMALQYIMHSGARNIIAIDPVLTRNRVAQRLGAHQIISLEVPYSTEMAARIRSLADVDIAFDFSGNAEALWMAAAALRRGGTLMACGGQYTQMAKDALQTLCQEEQLDLHWMPSVESTPLLERLVYDSIATKRVIVWPILSHTFPFEQAPEVYRNIYEKPDVYVKVLLKYIG